MNFETKEVPISDVENCFFERTIYDDDCDTELLANLKATKGAIRPVVMRVLDNGKYQVVSGTRVYRQSIKAGFPSITARIGEMSDTDALQIAISDNVFTKELSKIDVAKLLKRWVDQGVNQSRIAQRLGKDKSWVSRTLKLLETDAEIQAAIASGDLTAEHVQVIEHLPSAQQRHNMTEKVKEHGMSVKETEKAVEKSVARMDLEKKQDKLIQEIKEYEIKVQEAIKAKDDIAAIEARLAELEIKRKELNANISDEKIKQKAFSLEIVDSQIHPLESVIQNIAAEIKTMESEKGHYNVTNTNTELNKLQKKLVTAVNAVEKAKQAYDKAIADHKKIQEAIRPLQNQIAEYDRLVKQIKDKTQVKKLKGDALSDLVAKNKDVYDNYDKIRDEVDKHSQEAEKVMEITTEYTELASQLPSLKGKSNNKTRFEDVLSRKKDELQKVEQLINT